MAEGNGRVDIAQARFTVTDVAKLAALFITVGCMWTALKLQGDQLSKDVVDLSSDVFELRSEMRATNAKLDRYVEMLAESRSGVRSSHSTQGAR